ncbi:MAG: hypothetical protein M1409_09780, partial [Actinobacteria bacterium]|nr:hypothetical protein [Actinomycetota bacterium]
MKFFDSNIYIGQPTVPKGKSIKTAEELIKEMDKHNIEKSLVWHIAQRDVFPELGNTLLSEAIFQEEAMC